MVRMMIGWIYQTQEILSALYLEPQEQNKNELVAQRFAEWLGELEQQLHSGILDDIACHCLSMFLKTSHHLQGWLFHCYDNEQIPHTNNSMEDYIRRLKGRYRRISGRKNWSSYLLRHGCNAAYYEYEANQPEAEEVIAVLIRGVKRKHWREAKAAQKLRTSPQLKRYRFRHDQQLYLANLVEQWAATSAPT